MCEDRAVDGERPDVHQPICHPERVRTLCEERLPSWSTGEHREPLLAFYRVCHGRMRQAEHRWHQGVGAQRFEARVSKAGDHNGIRRPVFGQTALRLTLNGQPGLAKTGNAVDDFRTVGGRYQRLAGIEAQRQCVSNALCYPGRAVGVDHDKARHLVSLRSLPAMLL